MLSVIISPYVLCFVEERGTPVTGPTRQILSKKNDRLHVLQLVTAIFPRHRHMPKPLYGFVVVRKVSYAQPLTRGDDDPDELLLKVSVHIYVEGKRRTLTRPDAT